MVRGPAGDGNAGPGALLPRRTAKNFIRPRDILRAAARFPVKHEHDDNGFLFG